MKTIFGLTLLLLSSSTALAQGGERFDANSPAWKILAPEREALDKIFGGYSLQPEFQTVKHLNGASTVLVYLPGVGQGQLALFGIAADGSIAWRNYHPGGGISYEPRLAADDKGDVLLVWHDTQPRGVQARQFDSKGEVVWTQLVAALLRSDKAEEQDEIKHLNVVFWPKQGWAVTHSTFRRVMIHLLDEQGQQRWQDGVKLIEKHGGDAPVSLIQDSPGSILALWCEAGWMQKPSVKSSFNAQRIGANGKLLWLRPLMVGEAPDFSFSGPREIHLSLLPGFKVQADLYRGYSYDIGQRITEYQAVISPDKKVESHDVAAPKAP